MSGAAGPTDDAEVESWLAAQGLPGLLDVHTHFMPERVHEKVWAYFDSAGPLVGRRWAIRYRRPEAERLTLLRGFGARTFTAMIYPHKPGMAVWLNDWAAGFAARTPDVLHTATFYPEPGAGDYVEQAIAAGARVFKAHVQVGAYDPRDPDLDPVWGVLAQAGVPVVVHAGSGPSPGAFTGPGPFGEVLARHPALRAVVAHLGMPEYADFLALAERFPGVHLDTTMAFTAFTEEAMPWPRDLDVRLHALGAAGKVLFGSDFPNLPYPYADAVAAVAGVAERLGDDGAWLREVLWDGTARLFGLATVRQHAAVST